MKNKVETPIYLVTADIYLRFPEIMEEEYKDLLDYLDEEHILYERCTGDVNELQNKVQQLKWDIESVTNYYNDAKELYFKARDKVNQLETNWNYLKNWLKANDIHYAEAIPFRETLNKMQELERGNEND